jgi:hypothetical protein
VTDRLAKRLLGLGIWGVVALVLFALLYTASSHAAAGNSDGATVVLEGQSLANGHVLLHGWALSLDSFWTVDVLFYAVAIALVGLRDSLLNAVPAVIAVLVICVGMAMARSGHRGWPGIIGAASVAVILGLPSRAFSLFFLQGPLHVGTALWALLAFACLSRNRFNWTFGLAMVLFAAGLLGDLQMIALGVAPAAAAGVVAALRSRDWREGVVPISAACGGVVLAGIVREVAKAVGTFTIAGHNPIAGRHQMVTNVGHVFGRSLVLLGFGGGPYGPTGVPEALQLIRILAALGILLAVVYAILMICRDVLRPGGSSSPAPATWRLDDLLVLGFLADVAVFIVLAADSNGAYARYLTAALVYGSILLGRKITRAIGAHGRKSVTYGALVVGLCIAGAFGAGFAYSLSLPKAVQPADAVGQFLSAHGLDDGIGAYWSASIVTVATDGKVDVRPVITNPHGSLVRYERQSSASWYANKSFGFLVYNVAQPWRGVELVSATATFGRPLHTYVVGTYDILVWSHPITVSTIGYTRP